MKRILITGGAGFIGSNLAINIKGDYEDFEVIAFDNLKRRGSELNLQRLINREIRFFHGDIRNKEDLNGVGPADLIIDCSAEPSVLAGHGESPEYLINTNLVGTINTLELARREKADIIFLSTSRVYPTNTLRQISYAETDTRLELKIGRASCRERV